MLLAAPVAAVGSAVFLPLIATIEDWDKTDPRQMAVVFAVALASTWASLVAGKMWEGRGRKSRLGRRAVMLVAGVLVGLFGFGVASSTNLPSASRTADSIARWASWGSSSTALGTPIARAIDYAAIFGLAGFLAPGWSLGSRDRKARVRLIPVAWAGVVGGGLASAVPSLLPVAPLALAVSAFATQIVSPFSREASVYAREAKRRAA